MTELKNSFNEYNL